MNPKIVIRSETDADLKAITEVTVAAFKTLEISNHTEQFIIEALRAAKALTISLVAEVDGRVSRAYCFFASDHFGPYPELVWTWTCFGVAKVPAAGHW
jgi:hypothetical protein